MISKNQLKFVRQLEHKKFRRSEGLFVAEGPKVVGDLLASGIVAHSVYCTPEGCLALSAYMKETPPTIVSNDELRKLSFLQHPQQMLAVFHIPHSEPVADITHQLALALDGVQDPGNVGTIIRLADWFGISTILCSHDTADVYNPKVVQATMGSIAHVRVIYSDLTQLLSSLPADYPVYGTLLDGDDIYQQRLTPHGIIVMGNEGNGISPSVRQHINRRLLIPNFSFSSQTAESLNVAIATAITCSEFRRRSQKVYDSVARN